MKQMLSFLIARDTMHQQQWLLNHFVDGLRPAEGRWSQGPSLDGRGEFSLADTVPLGEEPVLSPPEPDSGAQAEQMVAPGKKK